MNFLPHNRERLQDDKVLSGKSDGTFVAAEGIVHRASVGAVQERDPMLGSARDVNQQGTHGSKGCVAAAIRAYNAA